MQSDDRSSLMIFLKNPQFGSLNLLHFFVETWLRSSVVHFDAPDILQVRVSTGPFFPAYPGEGGWSGTNKDNQAVALVIHARCICSWGGWQREEGAGDERSPGEGCCLCWAPRHCACGNVRRCSRIFLLKQYREKTVAALDHESGGPAL